MTVITQPQYNMIPQTPQAVVVDVTIAQGASLSEAISLQNNRLLGIITPAMEATTAKLVFLVSHDGVTWTTEHLVVDGSEYGVSIADVTKTYPLALDPAALFPWAWIKIEAVSSAGAAVAQATAARTLKLFYAPL